MATDDPNPIEPLTPEEEAELQKEVELALEPYKGIAPPSLLKTMREKLEEGLREHPVPRALLRRMAPRPGVDASAEVKRGGPGKEDDKSGGKDGA
jgi:hypothetical protein